ncbi:plasmid segregation protein ParM domain-containing protein [Escherichia coli]|nr:plasmid segregation protein ParM domain-containing protein [Escherichia coli]
MFHLYVTLPLSQFYTALGETNNENIQRKRQPDEAGGALY